MKKGALCLILLVLFPSVAFADTPVRSPQKVLICLDGVPLSMIQKLQTQGRFKNFRAPAPLISTFPAITEVMLTEFFGVAPPPGYGLRYYAKDSNVLQGGLSDPSGISIWFSLYDFITPMFDRGLTYLWGRWGTTDLDYTQNLLERFARSDRDILMIHLDSTDALMHNEPARVTERWLVKFDELILDHLAKNADRDIEVVLFSDHGNDMTRPKRIRIEKHLKAKGFLPAAVIRGDSGVAILPTGLISTAYMYTARKGEVARALRDLEGVDFALYQESGQVHIESMRGQAVIERRGDRYRYIPQNGDPLCLNDVIAAMREKGLIDADGFAGDRDWFDATLEHEYPDVLNRAVSGLNGHVENVGDVLLSLKYGYHSGSKFLSLLVHFHGTHGSLQRKSITGFLISNRRDLPSLRAEDALDHLGWREVVARSAKTRDVHVPSAQRLSFSCVGCGHGNRTL